MATIAKGYDLDYVWRAVGAACRGAGYYLAAAEAGEPPGTWWGPGAEWLGFAAGQRVEREPYNLLFGERKARTGSNLAGLRRTPGRRLRSTRAWWPPSPVPTITGGQRCGSRRSGRPASRRCTSI